MKVMTVRFAPSPTGRLHLGNLRTAVAADLWSKYLKCDLLVRYEDNDRVRSKAHFVGEQRRDLETLGVRATRETIQSHQTEQHFEMFLQAVILGAVYPCFASRREVADDLAAQIASAPHAPVKIYSGQWRDCTDYPPFDSFDESVRVNWRFRNEASDGAHDFIVARTRVCPELFGRDHSDFGKLSPSGIDFLAAYNWACALDDFTARPTLIVRAWDLATIVLDQRRLQQLFSKLTGIASVWPAIFHTSLVTDEVGHRLEKRSLGVTLSEILSSGMAAAKLREQLGASFSAGTFGPVEPAKIFGETLRTRTVSSLYSL